MSRLTRRLLAIACAAALLALGVARPHVVERWALYLGSASAPRAAHLYLDPFPDAASCESRVRVFAANAERAFCLGHREIVMGSAADALLALDFRNVSGSGAWCAPRRSSRLATRDDASVRP